jgi:hypothetical protein
VADWIDNRLVTLSGISIPTQSKYSPICIEGDNARYVGMTSISGFYTPSGETPVEPVPIQCAKNKWFADVPISPDGATNLTVSFQDGAKDVSATVNWIETNVITDDDMTIRLNDSLRLTGYPTGNSAGTVSITVDGQTYNTAANTPVVHKFETAGTFTIDATFTPDGGGDTVTGQMTVIVLNASFNGTPYVVVGNERSWTNSSLPDESKIEYDDSLITAFFSPLTGGGYNVVVAGNKEGDAYMTARLGENGPVMANTKIDVLDCSTHGADGYYTLIEEFDDGSKLLEGRIVLTDIPEDLCIKLTIYTSGTTFEDGTIVLWITADDFDENGVFRYRLLKSAESATSTCHGIYFYQGDQYLFSYRNW